MAPPRPYPLRGRQSLNGPASPRTCAGRQPLYRANRVQRAPAATVPAPEPAARSRRYWGDVLDASTSIVENAMHRTMTAIVAAAGIAAATLAAPKPAEARC